MARPSVIPQVLGRLEAYLNDREAEYLAQPVDSRSPTVPATPDGKVNVRAIAAAIGLKTTQEKYLYEREELSQLINLMAEGQGLAPIGSRLLQAAADKVLKERIVRQAQNAKLAEQAAVEAQAAQAELLEQLQALASENERLRAHNVRLQAQIDAMHAGVFIRVNE
ncbi:hypothetical protein BCh11DRAFT_04145 [Burkholderia sp. Ch1-1]|uniref:Uncharacterized protein n=1 Tax=Paraburkholderia phytofirmans OLGA172 TaxID=1417228 RepID=A0A160FGF4_9BURK|nr:hypothetical protein [Paraburkholderia phytofirmans]ANB71149.1 hypothetical protein AYM40_01330 [Paraburkholderia phytofirmans OLGA172]EIF28725.1 hypothetical protein BCh11DRAFT_04145 [Burkholderia sp. Ch1-1]